ncbi:MAG: hypothetical protein JW749_10135 [Sedimentisphaerales bacterium]|nr:hypothetical protein [Sedimentisphaerales bacterium]
MTSRLPSRIGSSVVQSTPYKPALILRPCRAYWQHLLTTPLSQQTINQTVPDDHDSDVLQPNSSIAKPTLAMLATAEKPVI